jgi:methylated-DNA-[protein]-cysteine S-methyltransferase
LFGLMTEFQERALKLVSKIPRGKVATYKELARALGRPRAWRAVGNALAKNPRPGVVPCHRVVRSDGRVGDYSLGRERKEKLLGEEGVKVENGKLRIKDYLFKF